MMTTPAVRDVSDILVSCLMVTLPVPDRIARVKASVAAFIDQTHPRKELLVIVNGGTASGRTALVETIAAFGRDDVRTIEPPGDLPLGALRNISLECAAGAVFCQWDDDDLYHPLRLEKQLAALMEGDHQAVYLQDVMQYFPRLRSLYWTNWRATEAQAHPGTLMIQRNVPICYPTEGPDARLGEDLQVALFLKSQGAVRLLEGMPHLFVYVSHGSNSWDTNHHQMLASQLAISKGLLQRREVFLRDGLRPFAFGSADIDVHGSNGLAFTIQPNPMATV